MSEFSTEAQLQPLWNEIDSLKALRRKLELQLESQAAELARVTKANKAMTRMLDRIAKAGDIADRFHAPAEECIADGVESLVEEYAAQAAELARVKAEYDQLFDAYKEQKGIAWKAQNEQGEMILQNAALKQQVAQLQGQLWEALAALGYPVPGETPPPRYSCGFCEATAPQVAQLQGALTACKEKREEWQQHAMDSALASLDIAHRNRELEADRERLALALKTWLVWCTQDSSKAQRDRAYLLTRDALAQAQAGGGEERAEPARQDKN